MLLQMIESFSIIKSGSFFCWLKPIKLVNKKRVRNIVCFMLFREKMNVTKIGKIMTITISKLSGEDFAAIVYLKNTHRLREEVAVFILFIE